LKEVAREDRVLACTYFASSTTLYVWDREQDAMATEDSARWLSYLSA